MKMLRTILPVVLTALAGVAPAQDPGKEVIGKVRTELLFGTNAPVTSLGSGVTELSPEEKNASPESLQAGFTQKFCEAWIGRAGYPQGLQELGATNQKFAGSDGDLSASGCDQGGAEIKAGRRVLAEKQDGSAVGPGLRSREAGLSGRTKMEGRELDHHGGAGKPRR